MSDEQPQGMDRRRFLTVLGVSGAGTAALSGCSTSKVEKLIPYLVQSEDQVPSLPTWYASTCTECAAGCGLHVKTREGRAIKLEGNPAHPVNGGALCARGQAGLQGLYNPGRLKGPMRRSAAGTFEEISWEDAIALLAERVGAAGGRVAAINGYGAGTFSTLLADWIGALGGQVVRWQPFDHEPLRIGAIRAFGIDAIPAHDFARARHIVAFGADFLETWLSPVEQQRGFAASHGYQGGRMARHVFVGPRMSLTGLNADEWLAALPGAETAIALAMTNHLLATRASLPDGAAGLRVALAPYTVERAAADAGVPAERIQRLAEDFAAAQPSLAVAGGIGNQHRGAHQLAAAVNLLNYVAGNIGQTVHFGSAANAGQGYGAVRDLLDAMRAGHVQVALVHEANPVYALPTDIQAAEAFAAVPFKVSTAQVLDETAALCDLLLPNLHALERWDDIEPRAAVRGMLQPVMEPVYPGRHTGDLLLAVARTLGGPLAGFTAASFEEHLKAAWGARFTGDAAAQWHEVVRTGGEFIPLASRAISLAPTAAEIEYALPAVDGDGEYLFAPYPSPMLYDGRGANRPWLMENPDPVTKITWQSWVEVHPDTARALDVRNGELLELTSPYGRLEVPVYIYAGIRPDTLAVPLGQGHTEYGSYATGRGVNAVALIGSNEQNGYLPYLATRVSARKLRKYQQPATTEGTPRQLGRHIAEAMPLPLAARGLTVKQAYEAKGGALHEYNPPREKEAIAGWHDRQVEEQQYGDYADPGQPRWAMSVDLSRCTGCSACITACYAENNIPVLGEEEIFRGREMTWMRIERYWEGGEDGEPLEARFVPMMCQHCDNAPCEPVCPVYAAYHTPDGLNGQVYNRCVGTRYCGNNCPYKVRYFNWYAYNKKAFPEPLNLQLNPDVTVRARGVMEKCTFCIQRIRSAQHHARLDDRPLRDGEFTTACAQACPSGALTFGNARDGTSRVAAARQDPRGYTILEDTNVRPAVTYLAKVLHRTEA